MPDRPPLAPPASKTPSGRFWFDGALVFLVFFVAGGDPSPGVNEPHYLCRLRHFWDPSYCPGDLFLDSPDAHFTVVWLFGWVTQLFSLEATAWIGRLVSWALIAAGWTRLVHRVMPGTLLAPLGAALVVYGTRQLHFAGEWLIGGFEAKTLAYGFVFFAIADAIDGRWNRAWILLGVASALHALVGGWSVVALGVAGLVSRQIPPVRSMLPALALGGGLAMAGVVPALLLNVGTPAEVVSEANEIYVFTRLSHHLSPLTKPWEWIENRGGHHLRMVAVLAVLHALRVRRDRPGLRLVTYFAWAAEAISLAGLTIELVLWNHPAWAASLLKYYWFRLADIAAPVAASILAVEWIGVAIAERRRSGAYAAVALVALCGWYMGDLVVERARQPVAASDAAMDDPAAWIEMCDWVRENTPADAVFLVPQQSQSFKWRAERGEVVTYKDVPQDARSMVEWRRRYFDVFKAGEFADGSTRWTPSLAALGAERLRELGEEYGATYVLSEEPRGDVESGRIGRRRASLPIVHRVGPYTLYGLADVGDP
ncbi:DUF6798 domain-containing protein [Botrimarina mediterranea]|uniref:DUF6798 domain-containing protein n=1 Tax=Botrimarina mediterranea TaxID=2528022 RepID=A0A518K6A2_9BACT|nr:DUF6798 domain-containing protein [Botrimarina mediterranea]QDV73323.1 hypothetical protein Spa11_15190 [Botrimarina mediterranea]